MTDVIHLGDGSAPKEPVRTDVGAHSHGGNADGPVNATPGQFSESSPDFPPDGRDERYRGANTGGIEGGIDAIVLGGGLDGLCAAALLGKAGLKTILIEAGQRFVEPERRAFSPGYYADDAEDLAWRLDPQMINGLDLYRQGLSFAARRISTLYALDGGRSLLMKGDWMAANSAVAKFSEAAAEPFGDFVRNAFDAARALREYFATGKTPGAIDMWAEDAVGLSAEALAMRASDDPHLQSIIMAEALLGMAARPEEPFSGAGLLRRWAGETAGLQGGVGYPADGMRGLAEAVRRAAQVAGVDHRHAGGVKRVLVEWDRVAGVEFDDGGQIRAPVVVSAFPAREAFDAHIGRSLLDIEFMHRIDRPYPSKCYIKAHIALERRPVNDLLTEHRERRIVYAPPALTMKRAHRLARQSTFGAGSADGQPGEAHDASATKFPTSYDPDGKHGEAGVMELFFPSAFIDGLAPANGETATALLGPFAPLTRDAGADVSERWRRAAEDMVYKTVEQLDPVAAARIVGLDVHQRPARDLAPREAERARAAAGAGGVDGYFFCGPEAQIGVGLSGGAGRRAATAAMRYVKQRRQG